MESNVIALPANPPTSPAAPRHLTAATKAWWRSVCADYALEPHHLRLLQLACEAWDRSQAARKEIARDGMTVPTANGLKAHPCIAIQRDSTLAFARLVREMDLDSEPAPTIRSAPPALRSNRRGR
jgi:P27 family predicted phage terminase small subunit